MNKNNYIKTKYNAPFIYQRADPYIYKHTDGNYYFTASVPAYDSIILRKSAKLDGLAEAVEVTVWRKHESGIMSFNVWAPELHYIDNKWYIYYAAGDKDDIWKIRPYVLECTGQNPLSDLWIERGMVVPNDEFSFNDFSLDMTIFNNKGKMYCVWAEKVNVGKKISSLYIAEMKTPLQLASPQVLLTTPDYEWERIGFWVNEGPAVFHHKGMIYLTYSASETGIYYCLGMLKISEEADILDPHEWKKGRMPVLNTDWDKGLLGPGHNSFTVSDDNTEDIMIYHARQYDEIIGDPLYDPNRHTYRMKIKWNDLDPVFDYSNNF